MRRKLSAKLCSLVPAMHFRKIRKKHSNAIHIKTRIKWRSATGKYHEK
jgi:hypothetical protein